MRHPAGENPAHIYEIPAVTSGVLGVPEQYGDPEVGPEWPQESDRERSVSQRDTDTGPMPSSVRFAAPPQGCDWYARNGGASLLPCTPFRQGAGFHEGENGLNGAPTARGCGRAEEFVNPSQVADRFHAAAVESEDQAIGGAEDPDKPLVATFRKFERQAQRPGADRRFRQDADELNYIRTRWLTTEGIGSFQAQQVTAVAAGDRHLEWEPGPKGG